MKAKKPTDVFFQGYTQNPFVVQNTRGLSKKNLTYAQARQKGMKINPWGDADRDGKINMIDCYPFNKKKKGAEDEEKEVKRLQRLGDEGVTKVTKGYGRAPGRAYMMVGDEDSEGNAKGSRAAKAISKSFDDDW